LSSAGRRYSKMEKVHRESTKSGLYNPIKDLNIDHAFDRRLCVLVQPYYVIGSCRSSL